MSAHDILQAAAGHMKDRAATYDKPEGERSMCATVEAFRAITGIRVTQEQGWLFMALLKAVRSQQGAYRADSYEDGAAYFALAGEAAGRYRKKPVIRELYSDADQEKAGGKVVLAGHEVDTDFDTEKTRMPQVGTNGNEGEHYAPTLPAGYSWADAPPDATVLVMSTMTGAYHWADAFCDGARIYGANFERMGLSRNSGWKLIAHRPGIEPGWVTNTGEVPNLPGDMEVEVQFVGEDGFIFTNRIDSLSWCRVGSPLDIVRYRIVEDR